MISAALVSILLGLAASNMGIIPHEAHAYSVVMEFLLPLTIPLMLFRADMRNVITSTGTLLLAFLIGSGFVFYIYIYHSLEIYGNEYLNVVHVRIFYKLHMLRKEIIFLKRL